MGKKEPTYGDLLLAKNSKGERFRLTNKIESVWRNIGTRLGIEDDKLDTFQESRNSDALRKVFTRWMDDAGQLPYFKSYPLSWQGLYNLLNDVGKSTDADAFFKFLDA